MTLRPGETGHASRKLVGAFATLSICALMAVGLSGIPGSHRGEDSGGEKASAWTGFGTLANDLVTDGKNGTFCRDLQTKGSRWWSIMLSEDSPASARVGALGFLRDHGTRRALETVVPCLADEDTQVGRAAEEALLGVLGRHSDQWTFTRLGTLLRQRRLGEVARRRGVAVLGRLGHPDGQRVVLALMGRNAMLDTEILPALGRLSVNPEAEEGMLSVAAKVRGLLQSDDPTVRRESASVLGRLGDTDGIGSLIELLDDSDRGVRGNAHWALGQVTGLEFSHDASRWRSWLAAENAWWEDAGKIALGALASDDPGLVARAIRSFSTHPLFREEAREDLEALAFNGSPAIRRVACLALGRMRSRPSQTILLGALADLDADVRAAARDSLCEITGRDLPADVKAWKQALGR